MNVYQKINEVKKIVAVFKKDAATNGKGAYRYVSGSQILGEIKSKMEELGLLFLPVETENRKYEQFNYKNQYGDEKTDFLVSGKLVYEWIDIDNPTDRQRVLFDYYGQQGDLSKAFGSALTYSERYLLLKSLGIPTDDEDPDNGRTDEPKKGKTPDASSKGNNAKKSKYAVVTELLKGSAFTLEDVTEYIKNKYEAEIKINDLNEEQYGHVVEIIKKNIKK